MDIGDIKYLEAPVKVITKLSDAIRIGSKIRPQCFGFTFDDGGSCAIGAAYEAVTGSTEWPRNMSIYDFLANHFSVQRMWLRGVVAKWNDLHNMSREDIADRLEAMGL